MNQVPDEQPDTGQLASAEGTPPPSLEEEFARCQDELLGMLYYLVGNMEDARDSLQETFVKCWRNRHKVPEIRNLRAWIFRIAMNAGRDMRSTAWRRRRKSLGSMEPLVPSRQMGPPAEAAREEQLGMLRQAVGRLRSEEQEVFLLRQNGQMTYEQIAHSIEIPVSTVKTRMRLALTKLRKALETKP
jgi:RNA polymerase sigma factor (sigma-70 family)